LDHLPTTGCPDMFIFETPHCFASNTINIYSKDSIDQQLIPISRQKV